MIKNKAIILHGTDSNSKANWFPWLKQELQQRGWLVWVPNLPESSRPNIKRYNEYILKHKPWDIDKNTYIVGHSSGAVAILGLLQHIPRNTKINTAILIGSFKDNLGWQALDGLFTEQFDFEKIKSTAQYFFFIHSDNDPYCPLQHAQYLAKQLSGNLIIRQGQGHFNLEQGEHYKQFPYLLKLIVRHSFFQLIKPLLERCRPGDLNHANRVADWVEKLSGDDTDNWEILTKAALVHDLGWYGLLDGNDKITKQELKQLEPMANGNSDKIITKILKQTGETRSNINTILALVKAADKHKSTNKLEAIIVDADNLSKLNMNHIIEKYKQQDWLKMLDLWKNTFDKRIKTPMGRSIYPKLLHELDREIQKRLRN